MSILLLVGRVRESNLFIAVKTARSSSPSPIHLIPILTTLFALRSILESFFLEGIGRIFVRRRAWGF